MSRFKGVPISELINPDFTDPGENYALFREEGYSYYSMGANVVTIAGYDKKEKKITKQPYKHWGRWVKERQSYIELTYILNSEHHGIALINGINGWRSIDIDGCDDLSIAKKILKALNLPLDYKWLVESGSRNGFHIWIRCDDDSGESLFKIGKKKIYKFKSRGDKFDHIELRWANCCTIVPPSNHPSGNHYKFLNGIPDTPPPIIQLDLLMKALKTVVVIPPNEMSANIVKDRKSIKYPLLNEIITKFDLIDYAQKHFGDDIREEANGEYRIKGHGGLLIKKDAGIWYCFIDEKGGNCIDLVGYRLYGDKWDRDNGEMFKKALEEAANYVGIELEDNLGFNKNITVSTESHHLRNFVKQYNLICIGGKIYRYLEGCYTDVPKEVLIQVITNIVGKYSENVKKIYEGIQSYAYVLPEKVNPKRYLNLSNGIFDTKKLKLFKHTPKLLSTIRIPINYDSSAKCSKFLEFLDSSIPEKSNQLALQEYLGYALSTDTQHHVAMFLVGTGSNGKGVLTKIIKLFFGEKNISFLDISDFGDPNKLVTLFGKLINISSEMSGDISKRNFKIFKQVTSFEEVVGKYLYQDIFVFTPIAKMIFSVNLRPNFPENNMATFRRLLFIDFPNEFSEERGNINKNLYNELKEEREGIFNWCIEGLKRLRENGKFSQDEYMIHQQDLFRINNDSIGEFVKRECRILNGLEIIKSDLYDAYKNFCKNYGVRPQGKTKFGQELLRMPGISDRRSTNSLYYTGIDLIKE